ncbi:MAG: sigma-E factor negative regulatory protein [Gammaproteobacteria bacterium]|nr:sigma-E factor negative regulatory protein [Gammaproteobacteria bacterium]
MNEMTKEQLSALMDGEADGQQRELIDELLQDPELLETWSRYHLISDCLQQHAPAQGTAQLDRDLAARVAKSLEQEPTILAPTRVPARLVKPVTGFAIAASVAALAIFGIQQQQLHVPHNVPHDVSGDPLLQATPGSAAGGNIKAPVRQVSTGAVTANRECELPEGSRQQTEQRTDNADLEEGCQ